MKASMPSRDTGLTANEVVVILAIVMLLAAFFLLMLGPTSRAPRKGAQINCVSNLKQVGLAWLTWVHDHEARDLPFRTPVADGGTSGNADPLRNQAWWQYAAISNEIGAPKVLVCPADKNAGLRRKVAANWSATDKNEGFMSAGFRDRAVSYTIGLDATQPHGDKEWEPSDRVLGSDRNIGFGGRAGNCSSGVGQAEFIRVKGKNGQNPPAAASWTNAIHGLRGNVLSLDGGVQQTSTRELGTLCNLSDDNGNIHFLVPR